MKQSSRLEIGGIEMGAVTWISLGRQNEQSALRIQWESLRLTHLLELRGWLC